VVQDRVGDELARAVLGAPLQADREAPAAGFARRVLHMPAITAHLKREAAFRRGGSEAVRDPAPRRRRQRRQPGAQNGVFSPRLF
jgi:hypothetical protein